MAKDRKSSRGAAAELGRLIGASIALPAAALVYVVASLNGAAVETIVLRAVATGAAVFLFAAVATRLIAASVARERARRTPLEGEAS